MRGRWRDARELAGGARQGGKSAVAHVHRDCRRRRAGLELRPGGEEPEPGEQAPRIQTKDSTPPDIYPVTFVPTPLNGTPTPTPPTVQGMVHVLCSFNYQTCPKIEIVDRGKGDSVVSEPVGNPSKRTTLIGKQMNLLVRPADATKYTLQAASWTLFLGSQGDLVKDYDLRNGQLQQLSPPGDLSNPTLLYYYVVARNGYPIAVEARLIRKDNPNRVFYPEAGAKYDARGPTNITLGAQATTVQAGVFDTNGNPALSLGTRLLPPASYGIHFTFTATAPPTDTDGHVAMTQLISSNTTYTPFPPSDLKKVWPTTNGQWLLDACASYPGFDRTNPLLFSEFPQPRNGQYTYVGYDVPGTRLYPEFDGISRSDSFRSYFMYKPASPGSIWVPLGVYLWSWEGAASRTRLGSSDTTTNVWTLTSSQQSTPGFGQAKSEFPVWPPADYNPNRFVCDALP